MFKSLSRVHIATVSSVLAVLAIGENAKSIEIPLEEARARAVTSGRIFERMWDFLTDGDPES